MLAPLPLRCRSFGLPGCHFRLVPFFHRTAEVRRQRLGLQFDTPEQVAQRNVTFTELWLEAFLRRDGSLNELEVELCAVHGIFFGQGESCPGCGVLTPAKERAP